MLSINLLHKINIQLRTNTRKYEILGDLYLQIDPSKIHTQKVLIDIRLYYLYFLRNERVIVF